VAALQAKSAVFARRTGQPGPYMKADPTLNRLSVLLTKATVDLGTSVQTR
jgi:hypothetical protein